MKKAVFFDRDGVLTEAIVKNGKAFAPRSMEELRIVPGARSVLENLAGKGFVIIVVTNQPDIARKKMERAVLDQMNRELVSQMGGEKTIQEILVCPHDDSDHCECRKPKPGMLFQAQKRWDLDLPNSFLVGDREVDMKAGRAAQCKTILINAPYNQDVRAGYRAENLMQACHWISLLPVASSNRRGRP